MVALLRGVNVGGVRIAMADLRSIAERCGLADVATYVQSGNVVFRSSEPDPARVASTLEAAIAADAGIEPAVTVRTLDDMERIVSANPFADRTDDPTHLHVVFTVGSLPAGLDTLDLAAFAPEELAVVGGEIYLHLPDGMGRSELAKALTKISRRSGNSAGTGRNWRSVHALVDMLRAL